jgi:hypothetical protein
MRAQDSFYRPAQRLGVRYTGKPVSGWGGLVLPLRYLEGQEIWGLLSRALPDGRRSPNQIPVVTMALVIDSLTGMRSERAAGSGRRSRRLDSR